MADLVRRHTPGRYGTEIVSVSIGPIGGTNNIGGATPLTVNDTTRFRLGGFGRRVRFLRLTACAGTVPADADGTILAHVSKFEDDGTTVRQLSADINLEGLTADVPATAGAYTSATEKHLVVKADEQILVDVVNNSAAINTQPATLTFRVELALLE